ncbi:Alpha-D-ribose 1-methylphosphonate 5-triphosphate synthase subunit PhnG [Achromobacter veterisilvae]|uniref:Alpha-D-ribose 1-methylphosphonate 5-triphosphate synthase subunit PhnG n=1 Tax=Achromobacter veterisilvae TaxID=2069367 RepID=A0A446CZT8_9BURK|nr:phosphonate C-P lyase system protein PhnG [Achromobacter veterisilvae]SSW73370.1 Alpha-D-ribose 1-methylphosphonate 5-triphosphate synthase subunit PhnG [Achromobacter veterisilvae]
MDHPQAGQDAASARRAAWMRVLALADPGALDGAFGALSGVPGHRTLRPAQTGMAMVRARSGGTGARFNLGEMTVTRCAVTMGEGVVGVAYVQGRSLRHAEQAAVADALLQMPEWRETVQERLIAPLARLHAKKVERQARVAAQTKVEFFTMVRGED